MEKSLREEWRPVRGFEDWAEISNYGLIHYYGTGRGRCPDERWTYGYVSNKGYLYSNIGGIKKGVHVWVYMTFNDCDIPKGYEVNHIDEDKHNNRLDNLNLMTPKENSNWGTGIARMAAALTNSPKISKAVQALDKVTGEVVYEFPSTAEAGRQGFNAGSVSQCCNGKLKTHKGLVWRFAI